MLKSMRAAIGATAAAGALTVVGLIAPAGEGLGTMEPNPDTVAPGDTVTLSSITPCPNWLTSVSGEADGIPGSAFHVPVDEEGSWSVEIAIPEVQPAGTYIVEAWCHSPQPASLGLTGPAQQQAEFRYAPETITVVAPEQEPTTTTTTAPPAEETPPAAEATQAAPTYTG